MSVSIICGQTFTPDTSHNITAVELELFDYQGNGLDGTLTAEIKATAGGLPTGSALTSGTLAASELNPGHFSDTYNDIYKGGIGGDGYLYEVCFSQNGLHMYSLSYKTGWSHFGIHHYILSTAWDITSASLNESHRLDDWADPSLGTGYFFAPKVDDDVIRF